MARVKAILRRVEAMSGGGEKTAEKPLERGGLSIDFERRSVHRSGVLLDLTAKEFDLLAHFVAHPGRVYTRTDLVDAIWGPGYEGYEHTVNSHINRLRGKVNAGGPRQRFIQTVWGVGYRFTEEG